MMSPFLSLPGAVGEQVALHYGSPLAEQRALDEGNAVVDLSHRGVVTVSGADRLSWLNSMTSQDLLRLSPGESTETLLLDANGRIEHAIRVVDDGETAWLLVDEGSAEALTAFLSRMRFALRVEVRDVSDAYATVLAFEGGTAATALRALDPAIEWRDPWGEVARGGTQYARGEHAGAGWGAVQFVFPRTALDRVARTAGAAGLMALDALEIRAWRPSLAGDVDERSIPHEYDWLRTAVHLTKGCYRGQETVAKVHNLGHPPRRLVLLHLDGSEGELPVPGALILKHADANDPEARPVGRITRAALHYEWGGIALALLKRATAEGLELVVRAGEEAADPKAPQAGLIAATQEVIVPTDAGKTRTIPKLTRL